MVGVEQFGACGRIAAHVALFEDEFPRLQKNLHHLAVEAAGLGEEKNSGSHGLELRSFDFVLKSVSRFIKPIPRQIPMRINVRIGAGLRCSETFDRRNMAKLTAATKKGKRT